MRVSDYDLVVIGSGPAGQNGQDLSFRVKAIVGRETDFIHWRGPQSTLFDSRLLIESGKGQSR